MESLAKEFGLSDEQARELVSEETRVALLRSKLAWLVLLSGIGLAGWLYESFTASSIVAFYCVLGSAFAWLAIGRYQARPAIRMAAAQKAARLHGSHS